jgi:hypothetical protein
VLPVLASGNQALPLAKTGASPDLLSVPASTVPGMDEAVAEKLAREVQTLLTRVGLREVDHREINGFSAGVEQGEVTVRWFVDVDLFSESYDLEENQPLHPLVRFERGANATMVRALAELLHSAGYTVILLPQDPGANAKLQVTAGPDFKAFASG